jgi:hypothetical protein
MSPSNEIANWKALLDLVGIDCRRMSTYEMYQATHDIQTDHVVEERKRKMIDALPPRKFSAAKFMELPWDSGYWRNALPPAGIIEAVIAAMSEAEKIELRARVKTRSR